MSFMVDKNTGAMLRFYEIDPNTGETKDDIYYLRRERAKHHAAWGGVCAGCQRTYPCPDRKSLTDALNAQQSRRRVRVHGAPVRRPYKRSDIPTGVVLAMLSAYAFKTYAELCKTFPNRIVRAALRRDMDRGYIECGTSETLCWLTPKGESYIKSIRLQVYCDGE